MRADTHLPATQTVARLNVAHLTMSTSPNRALASHGDHDRRRWVPAPLDKSRQCTVPRNRNDHWM